ncbi:TauD/TfdA family dioxygenase [Streptomyces sp. MBT62]|uniref:TauD/TfdA family dioxygenase n=1 Tax=Streptomyces sp. MBT62 TaxID=2800410 RepID=UPI00190AFE37|nr:TauD/TfdA family dioxygenase [Streptomyces sp. MBT62]MBK3571230.1 TauD/TfdA family dioxygenase [Streptomyces sp. MBT62]
MTFEPDKHERQLIEQGYTLIEGITSADEAEVVLKEFGTLIPQYNGEIRYDVKASDEYRKRTFSKSVNGIPWHIDAPSWEPPPLRMALHCRRQARCGAGHTELVDMRPFIASLDEEDHAALYERAVPWIDRNTKDGVTRPIIEVTADGQEIIRWRQSLLVGNSDPRLLGERGERRPLGEFGVRLAELSDRWIAQHMVPVLIPDDAILLWDNVRLIHRRGTFEDPARHLARYWMAAR